MDDDVDMGEADSVSGSEYPEPGTDERTPYPNLPQSAAASPSAARSRSINHSDSTGLADYFRTGEPVSRHQAVGVLDEDSLQDSIGQPWTNDFFERLANPGNLEALAEPNGRGRRSGRPVTPARGDKRRKRGGWKWALKNTEHANLFEKPKRGKGSRGSRRGRRGGRAMASVNATGDSWIEPSLEFKEFMREANKAFLAGDLDTALDCAKQAVLENSEVFVAHKMIHSVLEAQGDERGAVTALSVGVNTIRNADLWAEVGDRILALEQQEPNDAEWARSCYMEAIKLNGECLAARAGKLKLDEDAKDWDAARLECKMILKKWPENLDYVYKYAELCDTTLTPWECERGKEAYERAIECYKDKDMLGDDYDDQWAHLNVYLDLLLKLGQTQLGVKQLKRLARWFLGRKDDIFWDDRDDDVEFDITNERRIHLWQFQQGRISRDDALYGNGLPLEIRVKLGIFRMRSSSSQEAFMHFEHLKRMAPAVEGYEDMFIDVAECLRTFGVFGEALKYYEAVKHLQDASNQRFWLGIAHCYDAIGQHEEAEECYLAVAELDEHNIAVRLQLARLYNRQEQWEQAVKMVEDVTYLGRMEEYRRRQLPTKRLLPLMPKSGVAPPSTQPPPQRNIEPQPPTEPVRTQSADMPESQKTKRQRIENNHIALRQLGVTPDSNDITTTNQWIKHANALQAEFRRTRKFYLSDNPQNQRKDNRVYAVSDSSLPQYLLSEMEQIKKRANQNPNVGEDIPRLTPNFDNFFGISLSVCHQIFSELALIHAKRADQEDCYDIIEHVLAKPAAFRLNPDLWNATQAVRMCCALMFNDSKQLTDTAQEYISQARRSFGIGEAVQLLAASARLSHGDVYFYDRKMTRALNSLLDTQEQAVGTANRRNGSSSAQFEVDAGLLALYGNSMLHHPHANSKPALPYLLRALALKPDSLVVNLSIGIHYITYGMRNHALNRQYDIAQGQAFVYRYYDLRVASGKAAHLQEAEFNLARMWHQLGLMHLAVPGYEKVLKLSNAVREEDEGADAMDSSLEDFAAEAAFALRSIYLAAGNEKAATRLTEEHLCL